MRLTPYLPAALAVALLGACRQNSPDVSLDAGAAAVQTASVSSSSGAPTTRPEGWDEYWYSGLAELNI